jgi:hypothetical protein
VSTNGQPPARPREDLSELLPVVSLRAALPYLRRPYAPDAVRWKIQTTWPKDNPRAGQVVAYIDARLVIERLNLVVGELWSATYDRMSDGLLCRLTIDGVTRCDIGDGKGKAAYSDALKRAAVQVGIGVSLYALPAVRMRAGTKAEELPVRGPEDKRTLRIDAPQLEWLKTRYEMWLDAIGREAFGEPLDHGDVLGSQGDPDVPPDEPEEATEALFEDPEPPRQPGRRIKAEQAEEFAERFNREAPEHVTPDDLNLKLRELTGSDQGETLDLLRSLRGSQLAELNGWLEAVKGGALA